jgi:hypothetical protein
MLVVGLISSTEEAKEIDFIAKVFIVGKMAAKLAHQRK